MYSSIITFISAAALMIIVSGQIPAFAQTPQQTPNEQALIQKLMEEINSNLSLRAQIVQLQDQLKQKDAKPEAKDQPHPEKFEPKK